MKGRRRILSWIIVAVILAFLFLPVITVVLFAFNGQDSTISLRGFSLQWFTGLARTQPFLAALRNTGKAAALSVAIDLLIGVPAALALAETGGRIKGFVGAVLALPLLMPGLIVGVAIVAFISRLPIALGMPTVVAGHVLLTLPLVIFVLLARLERLDMSVVAAARDLGASWLTAFRRVLLPLIAPAMLGAGLLAAAVSLDEFIITLFTNGGAVTVPLYLYSGLRFGVTPALNAIATIMIAISTIAILVAGRFVRATDMQ